MDCTSLGGNGFLNTQKVVHVSPVVPTREIDQFACPAHITRAVRIFRECKPAVKLAPLQAVLAWIYQNGIRRICNDDERACLGGIPLPKRA